MAKEPIFIFFDLIPSQQDRKAIMSKLQAKFKEANIFVFWGNKEILVGEMTKGERAKETLQELHNLLHKALAKCG